MSAESFMLAGRILLVAAMSSLLPQLKGGSLTRPISDPNDCVEAMHAGASCTPCVSNFKMCRGHFVYEPFTVVLFEAFVTVVFGVFATFVVVPSRREAVRMLTDFRALQRVAPIGATYAVADLMDLAAARKCSVTTLLVASQMRLPLCALVRSMLLGRSQTWKQWVLLLVISLLCVTDVLRESFAGNGADEKAGVVATVASAAGAAVGAATDDRWGGLAASAAAWIAWTTSTASSGASSALPLLLGKCLISCGGAVHAEYFLQHKDVKKAPLWVTQVHFKIATMAGTLACGYFQGRRGGRILANEWRGDLFAQLPPDTKVGDPRMPFFGGWNQGTWLLLACLVVNNFVIGDQLRRLTSVSKYVAYAMGMVLNYVGQMFIRGQPASWIEVACNGGIGVLAVAYVMLPGPQTPSDKSSIKKD
eukprot:TRINITY_DN38760_c0_g2_i1.p1 TRINITY_DN38760_c0_g2~~TRINITY_DN38760_c0_g2_i1.p1  ORF type:complete len:420 (+),score=76.87 TRINITY_DN38760_c0_g2_i1:165-1424(+)